MLDYEKGWSLLCGANFNLLRILEFIKYNDLTTTSSLFIHIQKETTHVYFTLQHIGSVFDQGPSSGNPHNHSCWPSRKRLRTTWTCNADPVSLSGLLNNVHTHFCLLSTSRSLNASIEWKQFRTHWWIKYSTDSASSIDGKRVSLQRASIDIFRLHILVFHYIWLAVTRLQ